MSASSFDIAIEEMMKADAIRAAYLPDSAKNFYFIEEPWTMLQEPWRCQWFDKRTRQLCEVNTIGNPESGDKYAMFIVYTANEEVKNYVFLMDKYHFVEEK